MTRAPVSPSAATPARDDLVAALEAAERVMAAREFAALVPLEGVEPPTEAEWTVALQQVREALKAAEAA